MIDIYATRGTFADPHRLARDAATTVMAVEQVPDIPMFRQNTAAFVHELDPTSPRLPRRPTGTPSAVLEVQAWTNR